MNYIGVYFDTMNSHYFLYRFYIFKLPTLLLYYKIIINRYYISINKRVLCTNIFKMRIFMLLIKIKKKTWFTYINIYNTKYCNLFIDIFIELNFFNFSLLKLNIHYSIGFYVPILIVIFCLVHNLICLVVGRYIHKIPFSFYTILWRSSKTCLLAI